MVQNRVVGGLLRGREIELGQLETMVGRVICGGGGVLLIEGMPGIGKSALIDEVARIGRKAGCVVAVGRADELDQISPMTALLSGLRSGDRPLLAARDLEGMQVSDQRMGMLDRLAQILDSEAARRPLVISLDDLQWADDATVLAIASLPLRLISAPILWVLARRSGMGSTPVDAAWRRLAEGGADIMYIGPVSPGAVVEIANDIIGAVPGPSLSNELTRAAGNPFYLTQFLQRLVDTGALDVQAGTAHLRRDDVQLDLNSLASHLTSLSEPARHLVQIGAVLGHRFSLSTVADMLGVPVGSLVEAVAECRANQLLADDAGALIFQHDLLRQAAYADLPTSVRVALHRDAARILADSDASPLEVAPHLALGARSGDHAAIGGLRAAAAELLGTNPGASADLVVRALELLPPEDPRRVEVGATAVDALGWAGRLAEAEILREHLVGSTELDPVYEAMIEIGIRRSWAQGASRPYHRPLPPRLLDDPALPPALRVSLLALEAVTSMTEDLAGTAECLQSLRSDAEASGADFAVAAVWIVQLTTTLFQGRLLVALDEHREAVKWSERGGSSTLRNQGFHFGLAHVLYNLDRLDDAFEAFEISDREARRLGATFLVGMNEAVRSAALLSAGRLEDAAAAAESARQMAEDFGFGRNLAESLRVLGQVALAGGDLAGARTYAERIQTLLTAGYAVQSAGWMPALLAEIEHGPRQALSILEPSIDRLARGDYGLVLPDPERMPVLVEWCLRADRLDLAATVTERAETLAGLNPETPLLDGVARHCQALLDRDEPKMLDAVDYLRSGQRPLALAAAQEDLGALRMARGDLSGSAEPIGEAFEISIRCGAQRAAARLRQTLRRVGIVKRLATGARPTYGWDSLTDAERAVVKLVATGHSSRAVAEQLFVSTNTVNTHLRHIFTKLGIRSRVELTRAVLDHDRVLTR